MSKSKKKKSCKQKKPIFERCASFHHPGSVSSPPPYSLLFFPLPRLSLFSSPTYPVFFPHGWCFSFSRLFLWMSKQWVIMTGLLTWPRGKVCSQWLVVDGQAGGGSCVAKASPGSILISQSSEWLFCAVTNLLMEFIFTISAGTSLQSSGFACIVFLYFNHALKLAHWERAITELCNN